MTVRTRGLLLGALLALLTPGFQAYAVPPACTSGTVCRPAATNCEFDAICNSSGVCPANPVKAAGSNCGAADGICDQTHKCDGSTNVCPSSNPKPQGSNCGAAEGICDQTHKCDGVNTTCPASNPKPAGSNCGDSLGACDNTHVCDGRSTSCPDSNFKPAGTVCAAPSHTCDPVHVCSGNTASCPEPENSVCAAQVAYAANLTNGDSIVNITNTGQNGASLYGPGFGEPAGNICVNVYAFSPDEQMVACCSCPVTPNGLVHLTANRDLVSNTLTGIQPNSIVIKLIATATGVRDGVPTYNSANCTNSASLAGSVSNLPAPGLLAWRTTLHSASGADPAPVDSFSITETPFQPATITYEELATLRQRCANITGNGSTFGICRSCRLGGLGAEKQ